MADGVAMIFLFHTHKTTKQKKGLSRMRRTRVRVFARESVSLRWFFSVSFACNL